MGQNKKKNNLGNNIYFDPKMGFLVSLLMGSMVFLINIKYGIEIALVATLKQMAYTFFVGGSTTRICENLSVYFENKVVAAFTSTAVASSLTIAMTYLVHSLKGTPGALESTMPTLLGAPPTLLYWSLRKRRQLEKSKAEDEG